MKKTTKISKGLGLVIILGVLVLNPLRAMALPSYGSGTASNPYLVSDCAELQSMKDDLNAHYALINNIYCAGFGGGSGFEPIGSDSSRFTGSLEGNGFDINNLTINRSSTDHVGLIGYADSGSVIKNIGLINVNITGSDYVGGLAGVFSGSGEIVNAYVQGGTITASDTVAGGVAGSVVSGATIENSYSTATVDGTTTGGLAGHQSSGNFTNSFWDTEVSGESTSAGGTGRDTATMKTQSNYTDASWDFTSVWSISGGANNGYPTLSDKVSISTATPQQSDCQSGTTTYTWQGEGLARPTVSSMTVDGETITDPANPASGSIGVVICPNTENARKVGLMVVYNNNGSYSQDLTNAETPNGDPITANSNISVTLNNMGDIAQYYTFSLVHGLVGQWNTANLGTTNASLSFTAKPVRTPVVDFMAPGAQMCSATPPTCTVQRSALDILTVSLDMDFDQAGTFAPMAGSYFGLDNAVSGYVTNQDGKINATLGAPHFMADGTTLRSGSMRAFLPDQVVQNVWGVESSAITTDSLSVSRSEDGETDTTQPPFNVEQATGGIVVSLSGITFSTPTYSFSASGFTSGGASSSGSPNTSESSVLADTGQDMTYFAGVATLILGISVIGLLRKKLANQI